MDCDELATAFKRGASVVRNSSDVVLCWSRLLEITGQSANRRLTSVDVQSDVDSLVRQLKDIFEAAPLTNEVGFLYFGLFDRLQKGKEVVGYYVSGWTGKDPNSQLAAGGEPPYFPKNCYLNSDVLDTIKAEGESTTSDERRQVFDYAVMFAAAATLSRFACLALDIQLPVYVGFDSGDFARVAN